MTNLPSGRPENHAPIFRSPARSAPSTGHRAKRRASARCPRPRPARTRCRSQPPPSGRSWPAPPARRADCGCWRPRRRHVEIHAAVIRDMGRVMAEGVERRIPDERHEFIVAERTFRHDFRDLPQALDPSRRARRNSSPASRAEAPPLWRRARQAFRRTTCRRMNSLR